MVYLCEKVVIRGHLVYFLRTKTLEIHFWGTLIIPNVYWVMLSPSKVTLIRYISDNSVSQEAIDAIPYMCGGSRESFENWCIKYGISE